MNSQSGDTYLPKLGLPIQPSLLTHVLSRLHISDSPSFKPPLAHGANDLWGGNRRVRCHGDVFGEMAVLDPEPRVASVTAVEDTQLLRLDQEPFYELMEDQIAVAQGIIRVLSAHLRNRVRDVTELRAKLAE